MAPDSIFTASPERARHGPATTGGSSEPASYDLFREVIERIGRFDTRPDCLNLLGIRGYVDGRPTENVPDAYNDTIAAVWRDQDGRKHVGQYRATVDPGAFHTIHTDQQHGVAHLVDGQYSYKVGTHKGRPALEQATPVTVWRDGNKDHRQDAGELIESGMFGINIHDGGTSSTVGKFSAGCQVVHGGRTGAAWTELMDLANAHPAGTISYTLVDRAVLGLPPTEFTPPAGVARSTRPTLRVGSRGVEVREAQTLLKQHDCDPGPVDGTFGRKTEAAVLSFQRARQLHADGIIGSQTWSALGGRGKSLDAAEPPGARRALLVAINDYGDPRNNLPSCVADAREFAALLEDSFDFEGDQIRVLLDGEATSAAVDGGLEWLLDGVGSDDRVVFFYSGHGFQHQVGSEMEEVLVLRDGFFQDDRLSARTQHLPHGVFTAVLDSCFSGGMEKVVLPSAEGGAEFAQVKRWTQTSPGVATTGELPIHYKSFGAANHKSLGAAEPVLDDDGEATDEPLKGVLMAACSENETASASTGKTRGLSAFTFALSEAIAEHGPGVSSDRLMATVASTLAAMGFRQTPSLHEGPGPFDLSKRSFVSLRSRRRETPRRDDVSGFDWLLNLFKEKTMDANYDDDYVESEDWGNDEASEKVFGLLAGLLPAVLPHVVRGLSRRRKDWVEDDGDEAGADKGLFDLVTQFAPLIIDGLTSGGGKPRRRGRKPQRKGVALAPSGDAEDKAFRMAMQLISPFLRAAIKVRTKQYADQAA